MPWNQRLIIGPSGIEIYWRDRGWIYVEWLIIGPSGIEMSEASGKVGDGRDL